MVTKTRVNDDIRASEVRLIDEKGGQVGIVSFEEARERAKSVNLDLIEISPDSKPPVVKILDYSKYRYEQALRKRNARKNQTSTTLKEVRFRLKIDEHDYHTKINHVKRFLAQGDKVKVGIMFRGREQQRPQFGYELLTKIAEELQDISKTETTPSLEGRNLSLVLASTQKRVDHVSLQRQVQTERKEQRLARQKQRLDNKKAEGVTNA
ncbi:MAG: translation initiation factor IF-3 [Bifidobacteriaceae bacterium]|nr:translation initiation factor IF-3 [Bifidobacteriaceae bacterium]